MKLVIVESPGKINKIKKILGNDYIIKASFGHFMDLPHDDLSIDVDNNFKPRYEISKGKERVVADLRAAAKKCSEVIIAADQDREGEMIAESIKIVLKLDNPKRIVFHEITKKAINSAISNPTVINMNMVHAQQARRLLDRLVGYKITPLLWNTIQGKLSAGRVQSAVLNIIIKKEEDIKKSLSSPYFKSTGIFDDINSTLTCDGDNYKFDSYEDSLAFLNKINKKSIIKVDSIELKDSIRKPSPPFTTSSLQQEASTKLGFKVATTMSIAQKLYEGGFITYMRTDSTNLSDDIISQCVTYVVDKYGEEYSKSKNYKTKSKNSQEAHEAIRPTKISVTDVKEKLDINCNKLYNLIWKRTLASQMAPAKIKVQTINIDIQSVLPDNTFYTTVNEKIEFDGWLVLYENIKETYMDIKKDTILKLKKINITEEYTKPPLRYNEANLVKYLEKKGIGRPSTFASIISKIQERNYVEIKDVKGEEKSSRTLELTSKFKVKEDEKKVYIGNEKSKLVPTDIGFRVNTFMEKNFDMIVNENFTSTFENYLDKIAQGKAEWYNILKKYYNQFNPNVEKLSEENKSKLTLKSEDKILGMHPTLNVNIYQGKGKYGDYVKIQNSDKTWKFANVKDLESLTLETAIELLEYPKEIGKMGNSKITINKGQFGLYLKKGTMNISIDEEVDITKAIELFKSKEKSTYSFKGKTVQVKTGPYGNYIQIRSGKKTTNISLPKDKNIEDIDNDYLYAFLNKKD